MKYLLRFSSLSTLGLLVGLGALNGCGQPATSDEPSAESLAQKAVILKACHLDDGTVQADADVRACDPSDDKKATICHVPPGNPSNAHTLCIGKPAVAAHLANHPDSLGPCKAEKPCPPPSADAGSGPICRPDDEQMKMEACHLDDGSIEKGAGVHACDPTDDRKTTICHLPPGNPSNAHTLCIGNAAVPAHLSNHHDHLGACRNETPCPPSSGTGGTGGQSCPPGTGGVPGGEGTGGTGGVPGGEGTGGAGGQTGGVGGTGGLIL